MTDSTLPGDKYHWRNIFSSMLELVGAYQRHEVSLTSLVDLLEKVAQPGGIPWASRFESELAELNDEWQWLDDENSIHRTEAFVFGQAVGVDSAVLEIERILRSILAYPDDVS